ncbi:MAG: hypothetical protein AAF515_12735 [Pseudomonadota bacterium]
MSAEMSAASENQDAADRRIMVHIAYCGVITTIVAIFLATVANTVG